MNPIDDSQIEVTFLGSLPPVVGISPYIKALVYELSKTVKINFLGFRKIYPSFLFPGQMYDYSADPLEESPNLTIRSVLDWFNPFGWIYEGFKINTDVIHAQWWSYPLAPIYVVILGIVRLRGKKIILTVHNVIPHEVSLIKIFLNKCVFGLADKFIVHSQQNKEQLLQHVKNCDVTVVPHGILKVPTAGISRSEARQELGILHDDKIILFFGHIREYKGLDTAIEALAQIKDSSVKLLIAGKCWEDWDKYQYLIDKHGLNERIYVHLGFIKTNKIEHYFQTSDLVWLPYKHFDAQSGVGALLLSFSIPFIVSQTGGLTDIAPDPCCIIQPNNPSELAEKTENILFSEDMKLKLVGDIYQKSQNFSWDHIAQQTIELY